jgi:diguanylate cyclase (GGDEF)-like protein
MLSTELKRAIRYKKVLILIMVDIDHFKKFNDTFGHQKGDSVLRTVGTILKENSRSSDIVCRYGGEEMAIILPEQDMNQGITTAEKLRKKLESEAYEIEGVNITASFGVGSTGVETKTIEELIKKSDEALYLAKKSGRNCTKAIN